MSPIPVDVTKYSTLVFSVNVSLANAQQQTRFGLADSTNNDFTYVSGNVSDTVTGKRQVSVDISNISGQKFLFACNYCALATFDFTITDINLY